MSTVDARVHEYRAAREAQARRFEQCGGGISIDDTKTVEYRAYFGIGEYAPGVEQRVTWRRWIAARPVEQAPESLDLIRFTRPELLAIAADLGHAHCLDALDELSRRQAKRASRRELVSA